MDILIWDSKQKIKYVNKKLKVNISIQKWWCMTEAMRRMVRYEHVKPIRYI